MYSTAFLSQRLQIAEDLFALYDEGHMRACSIGFHPLKLMTLGRPREAKLEDGVQETWYARRHNCRFVESLMVEYSLTAIGADKGALRQSFESGKIAGRSYDPQLNRWLKQHMAERETQGIGFDAESLKPGSLVLVLPDGSPEERVDAMLQSLPVAVADELESRFTQSSDVEAPAGEAETETEAEPVTGTGEAEEPAGVIEPVEETETETETETLNGSEEETPADETETETLESESDSGGGVDGEADQGTNQPESMSLKQRLALRLQQDAAVASGSNAVLQSLDPKLEELESTTSEMKKSFERLTGILPG
jgi:hypothetical protein